VEVDHTIRLVYLAASLIVGAVVAVAGPVGFVGLLVPHALRQLLGPDHRVLVPASVLAARRFSSSVIRSPARHFDRSSFPSAC